ncbi:hypothetical protein [Blastopirellula retiformator]|uniref:Uncharacterized protein n=1 Tax=Blastopirellula retiformator TaxID=2527970 RepID=A0A5C5VM08_9BACT|nr:hypothetical protein [Blastopirellula retiformator]TWT38905.1 hypothetical protein Enr8_05990 [Blastopirellula retiformator]
MSEPATYFLMVELKPTAESAYNPAEVSGIFTHCFVPSGNFYEAVTMFEGAIAAQNLELINIEWCLLYDSFDWTPEDQTVHTKLRQKAINTGEVCFGEMVTWNDEDEDEDE